MTTQVSALPRCIRSIRQCCEQFAHFLIGAYSLGERRREFRFHVLAETLAHPAHRLAQRRGALTARRGE